MNSALLITNTLLLLSHIVVYAKKDQFTKIILRYIASRLMMKAANNVGTVSGSSGSGGSGSSSSQ